MQGLVFPSYSENEILSFEVVKTLDDFIKPGNRYWVASDGRRIDFTAVSVMKLTDTRSKAVVDYIIKTSEGEKFSVKNLQSIKYVGPDTSPIPAHNSNSVIDIDIFLKDKEVEILPVNLIEALDTFLVPDECYEFVLDHKGSELCGRVLVDSVIIKEATSKDRIAEYHIKITTPIEGIEDRLLSVRNIKSIRRISSDQQDPKKERTEAYKKLDSMLTAFQQSPTDNDSFVRKILDFFDIKVKEQAETKKPASFIAPPWTAVVDSQGHHKIIAKAISANGMVLTLDKDDSPLVIAHISDDIKDEETRLRTIALIEQAPNLYALTGLTSSVFPTDYLRPTKSHKKIDAMPLQYHTSRI